MGLLSSVCKGTNLNEGAGDDCAGQFRLNDVELAFEKSPKCFDSEENFGALKPIGSEILLERKCKMSSIN